MKPFEPIGDVARWQLIYDAISTRPVGAILSYNELGELLNLHPTNNRPLIQAAMRRAAKHSEKHDKRALDAIPNKGYRIVEAAEHLRLAKVQQHKASNALVRGNSKIVNADLSGLSPELQKTFEVIGHAFRLQMDMLRRTDVRQRRLEEAVNDITHRSDRSESEISELRQRLERLENPTPTHPTD